jgi:amino acid transporter
MVPFAFGLAGHGAWLTVVIATIGMLAIGVCISEMATRHVSSGALYNLIPKGLGSVGGFLAGLAMLGITLIVGPFLVLAVGANFAQFLAAAHIATLPAWGIDVVELACLLGLGSLAMADIRVSTRAFLIIELISMAVVMVLLVVIVAHKGTVVDTAQFSLKGANVHGVIFAMGFLVLSFAGFEGATALGFEARKPRSAIPLALMVSVAVAGVFFVVNAYVEVLGFEGLKVNVATLTAPLSLLASRAGVGWLGAIVVLGVTISWFAALGGWLNYAPRVVYTMSRDGLLPSRLGRVMRGSGAPIGAIAAIGVVWLVVQFYIDAAGLNQNNAFGDMGTFIGYCFGALYLLVALSALVWLYRRGELRVTTLLSGIVGIGVMGVYLYYSFFPFPGFPINVYGIVFIVMVAAGAVGAGVMRCRGAKYLEGVGSTEDASEAP